MIVKSLETYLKSESLSKAILKQVLDNIVDTVYSLSEN